MTSRPVIFEDAYRAFRPLMRSEARRFARGLGGVEELEDLVSIASVGLWHAWKSYDQNSRMTFPSWAKMVVRQALIERAKHWSCDKREDLRASLHVFFEEDEHSAVTRRHEYGYEYDFLHSIEVGRLARSLSRLTERNRRVIELKLAGESDVEIGRRFCLSGTRIRQIVDAAMFKLGRAMNSAA